MPIEAQAARAPGSPGPPPLIIDDRSRPGLVSSLAGGQPWRLVSDQVMGGVSAGSLRVDQLRGRPCLRLRGEVSLANQGGFLQMSLDLNAGDVLDASAWTGIELDVLDGSQANGQDYNLHLRSADTRLVWQSYRAGFRAEPEWRRIRLPFADFQPHRIDLPLATTRLRRLGLVAIGREMAVDLCVARIGFY